MRLSARLFYISLLLVSNTHVSAQKPELKGGTNFNSSNENAIIYAKKVNAQWDLYAAKTESPQYLVPVFHHAKNDFQARYNPLTGILVFDSYRDNNSRNLFMSQKPFESVTQLTSLSTRDGHPDISHLGNDIVFQSGRSGDFEVYSMNLHSKRVEQLTKSKGFDGIPNWSPDGRRVAFNSSRDGSPNVYIYDRKLQTSTQLTNLESQQFVLDWHPNNQKLLLKSNHTGKFKLYWLSLLMRNEAQPTPLEFIKQVFELDLEHEITAGQIDQNGERLIFIAKVKDIPQVFIYHIETNKLKQLTFDNHEKRFPAFFHLD